jgi:GNAT superfamily N-acetyltransferase
MFEIRELVECDVAIIAATDGGVAWHGGEAKWRGYWREHLKGQRVAMVAARGDGIVGYGSLCWRSQYPPFAQAGTPDISDMVVAQDWRRQGVASRLIEALEARALAAGHSVIGIGFGLYADYGAAQQLYVRRGYVPDGLGLTYDNAPVVPGSTVRVDDDLVLWLSKTL